MDALQFFLEIHLLIIETNISKFSCFFLKIELS